jgi:hypothetical protein
MATQKRNKSIVWHYFEKSNKRIKCNDCLNYFSYSGNTTNLWDHLKRKHPRKYSEAFKDEIIIDCETTPNIQKNPISTLAQSSSSKQMTIKESILNMSSFSPTGSKQKATNEALLFMLCK